MTQMSRLMDLMARLRGPGGCPWDLEQTHETLRPYLIEEAYEVLEALDGASDGDLKEELGDLLLQVVFHARIAEETGRFDLEDVARAISEKLVRRHPHVFGDVTVEDSDAVLRNWNAIKAEEKRGKGTEPAASAVDGVPASLPGLQRARRVQENAARTGFEWTDAGEIVSKIQEELGELQAACGRGSAAEIEEELGDLLFAAAAMGRYLGVCPEEALRKSTGKFIGRFKAMESELAREGSSVQDTPLADLEAIWNRLRKKET